jgi:hypothetical protein
MLGAADCINSTSSGCTSRSSIYFLMCETMIMPAECR